MSKVLFYFSATLLLFLFSWKIILPIVLGYYTIQYIIIGFSAKKLNEPQIIYFLPFLEVFLMLFQFAIFITNSVSKPTHWK